jgi:multiple sugar transport system permease protein
MWLGTPELAMTSIITVHVWRLLPLATVILLAGLTSIPQDIHDAAAVDGAGFWRHLFQITIPLVAPIMTVAVLFGFIFAFTDMIVIYVLTRGGPYHSTQVLASLAFFTGIDGGDLAEGAAISLFLFPLLVAVAFLFLRLARRTEVV